MRSLRWSVWIGLGAIIVVAASCSSSDSKKKPRLTYESGDNAGGGANVPSGGDTAEGGGISMDVGGDNAGGQSPGTMTDGWLSGTRLRATLYVSGSSKMFKTWHDSELDFDCTFSYAADGTERCLPTMNHGYAVYSDSKCTKPVVVLAAEDEAPPYVMGPTPPFECHKGTPYLEVGATAAGVTDLYTSYTGTCELNGTLAANQIAKTLGAAISDSMFVASTSIVKEARDERLSANVRVAEDGSREVISHFDLERKTDCNPREHEGDGFGCVPEDKAYIEYFFSDDKCMTEAAYHPAYANQVCGHAPSIIQNSSPYFTDGYYEVGEQVSPIYRKNGTCDEYTSVGDPGATYYSVGKEVPFSSFVALPAKNEGKGRVLIETLRDASDVLVSREKFYDSTLKFNCFGDEAADHETRCLPNPAAGANLYADDKCEQALVMTTLGEAPNAFSSFLLGNAPDGGSVVYELGTKIAKPAKAYQFNGPTCVEAPTADDVDYYSTSAIPTADLAIVTLETE